MVVHRIAGALVLALCLLLLFLWMTGDEDPHGGIFAFITALGIGPLGVLFLVAAHAVKRRWRMRRLCQLLPLAYPALLIALFGAVFG